MTAVNRGKYGAYFRVLADRLDREEGEGTGDKFIKSVDDFCERTEKVVAEHPDCGEAKVIEELVAENGWSRLTAMTVVYMQLIIANEGGPIYK